MQEQKEISMNTCKWKDSPVFPESYLVSDDGKVMSKRSGNILKPAMDKYGYLYYVLCVNGERRTVKAHRLVASAYIPNPSKKPAVDHINGIKSDNRKENLRWVTNKENTHNPNTMPRLVSSAKARIPKMCEQSRLRNFGRKEVVIIHNNGEEVRYASLKEASEATGKSISRLSEVLNHKRKQCEDFKAVWASEIEEFCIAVTKKHFPEEGET